MKAEAVAAGLLREVEDIESYDVIGIDEGQFVKNSHPIHLYNQNITQFIFKQFPDIVEFCEEQANKGKGVLVSALDGTFMRSPFGRILELVPLAESVTKLSAICMLCHKDAAFSKRLGAEKEVEVIGGSDKYIAVCRKCYFKNIDRSKQITEFFKPTVEEREVKVVEDK